MPKNFGRCPFSKIGCKECPIYRGRHCYIRDEDGEPPTPAPPNTDGTDWIMDFNDFFGDLDETFRRSIKSYGWEDPDAPEK